MSVDVRWWVRVLVVAIALVGGAEPARSLAPASAADELSAGLAAASLLIEEGDYEAGREAVLEAVAAAGDGQDVLLQIHRVKELLKRAAFRASHEVPEPEDLIAGDLLEYDRRSGKIKVRYRASDEPPPETDGDDTESRSALRDLLRLLGLGSAVGSDDFTWGLGVPMHPIVFDGPYTIEVEGVMPSDNDDLSSFVFAVPEFVVHAGDEGYYRIRFGYPRILYKKTASVSQPASLVHVAGGRAELLDQEDDTPLELGKKYSVKINVSSKTITASANGRTFLKGRKAGDRYGQFGFKGCPDISELTLSGQANTAWVEGLEDRWRHDAWEEFDEVYDPLDDLPEALAERVGEVREFDESLLGDVPGKEYPARSTHQEKLEDFVKQGDYKKLITYVGALDVLTVGESYVDWILAQAHYRTGDGAKAAAHCDRLIERHEDYVPARLLKSAVLANAEDQEGCQAALREAIALGDDPRPHRRLAAHHVTYGRFDEARRVMVEALDAGIAPAELEPVAFMLTRAAKGPEWPLTHAWESKNYVVESNLTEKACAEASKALEAALAMYNRLFGKAAQRGRDEGGRYQVYLFSGQSSYLAYAGDLFGSQPYNTAGLYSPILKQLLIWNLPDHDRMLATVKHEGFHQYLDRLVGETPTWFNEGTAEYIETAELKRGRMTPGAPLMDSVHYLADTDTKWADMDELVRMSRGEFYADPTLHYAQSWALIHYLKHTDRDNSKIYDAYLEALMDGASQDEAADIAFADVNMRKLGSEVRAYIKEMAEEG